MSAVVFVDNNLCTAFNVKIRVTQSTIGRKWRKTSSLMFILQV